MTTPDPAPAITGGGPACTLCGADAVVNWQRRLTEAEVAEAQGIEQDRRQERLLLADPQLPPLDFGPLPDCADWTHAVYGCDQHGINKPAASHVHQATCTAPQVANLPGCDCTPEPHPQAPPEPEPVVLPAGW